MISFRDVGSRVTIGIVDSLYEPGSGFRDNYEVGEREDVIEHDSNDTTGHGEVVLRILTRCTDNARYNFYRVVKEEPYGEFDDGDVIEALKFAHQRDGVDIINLSIGSVHIPNRWFPCTESHQPCALNRVTEAVIADGIPVVAGAGNTDICDSMCCPSLVDTAICVAGFEPRCTAASSSPSEETSGSGEVKPPGAIWIDRPDRFGEEGPICSSVGCGPGEYCSDNQRTVSWPNNVDRLGNKPDTYAPVHFATYPDGSPGLMAGTSFAVPIVVGQIANMLCAFRDMDHAVSPQQIRRAIIETGRELDEGDGLAISAERACNQLGEPAGIRFERDEDEFESLGNL